MCRRKRMNIKVGSDLHKKSFLPQFFIEEQHVLVGLHHSWIKVHDTQAFQTPSTGQSDIRLAALKDTGQGNLHTIQSHALNTDKEKDYFTQESAKRKKNTLLYCTAEI